MNDKKIAAEILELVADKWESGELGWTQQEFWPEAENDVFDPKMDFKSAVCALGGIECGWRVVMGDNLRAVSGETQIWDMINDKWVHTISFEGDGPRSIATKAVVEVVLGPKKEPGNWLPSWNDEPERTKQEVIDAFKQAAKDLRNA